MIGRLRGILVTKQPPRLVLEVGGGVGYELEAPMSTFYGLPPLGKEVVLLTHHVVREDAQLLYGFATDAERSLFRGLLKVTGVGAKLALAVLSGMTGGEFARCVQDKDTAALTRLPGVGKKVAERLVVEMRDRLADFDAGAALAAPPLVGLPEGAGEALRDAVAALVALGYKPQEASRMVSRIDCAGLAEEEIIRAALQARAR
ncbi:Holliday junction branch migration protein RuvA [Ectothiorhodospiraceae bacterium 2226]|nr:Holliday junction branch migration protein RuvA [Ectothiorhodospiraceae bacterium 2226]